MSTESYTPLYISESTGLSVAQTYQLRENSRGIHTVRSFIHQRKSDPFQPQTAIGMANENYRRITSRLRLRKFELDYLDFTHGKPGADLRGVNTPVFMDVLYQQQITTVFFIPDDILFLDPDRFATTEELLWCLDNKSKLGHLEFVFGLYRMDVHAIDLLAKP